MFFTIAKASKFTPPYYILYYYFFSIPVRRVVDAELDCAELRTRPTQQCHSTAVNTFRTQSTTQPNGRYSGIKEIPSEIINIDMIDPKLRIGGGSFGDCFQYKFQGVGLCIKIYKDKEETGKLYMLQEAKALSSICHPNISWLWGIQSKKAPYYLVTTLYTVNGKPLSMHTLLKKKFTGSLEDGQALNKFEYLLTVSNWVSILCQIVEGLQALHKKNLLHQDLKNDNVVFHENTDGNLVPVIIDLGQCIQISKSRKYNLHGTAERALYKKKHRHIAPDVVDGEVTPCFATDVYSFGMIFQDVIEHSGKAFVADLVQMCTSCLHYKSNKRPETDDIVSLLHKNM